MKRVLVSYESSARGRAALSQALGLARQADAPVTVVNVATQQPVAGCGMCRSNAVMWNRELRLLAKEGLLEAAGLVGPSVDVDYVVAVGRPVQAIGRVAEQSGADVVVLPWEPTGRIRRLFASTLAAELRTAGPWEVVVAGEPAQVPKPTRWSSVSMST